LLTAKVVQETEGGARNAFATAKAEGRLIVRRGEDGAFGAAPPLQPLWPEAPEATVELKRLKPFGDASPEPVLAIVQAV
jgi:hypothetical protein